MQQFLEWLLAQLTNRLGQIDTAEALGIGLVGGTALSIAVSQIGKRLIRRFMSWWNGDGLPVRDSVQALLDRMASTEGWGDTVGTGDRKAIRQATNGNGLFVAHDAIMAGGTDIMHTLNRNERRKIRKSLLALLEALDRKRATDMEKSAEQSLKTSMYPAKPATSQETGELTASLVGAPAPSLTVSTGSQPCRPKR